MIYDVSINGIHKLIAKLNAATRPDVLKDGLHQGAIKMTAWIKRNRLSGPRPTYLAKMSGLLNASITAAQPEFSNGEYTNKVGTNVAYARYHEFGFRGTKHVRGHIRRHTERVSFTKFIARPGSLVAESKRVSRKRFSGFSYVEPYGYLLNYKGRPFMNPALQDPDLQQSIYKVLSRRVKQALEEEA